MSDEPTSAPECIEDLLFGATQRSLAAAFLLANPHLRFVSHGDGGWWYRWDGARYAEIPTAVAENHMGVLSALALEHGAHGATEMLSGAAAAGIFRRARSEAPCSLDDFDQNPKMVVFRDCTVDIVTGAVTENTPDQMVTRCAPITYTPPEQVSEDARAAWRAFLEGTCAWDADEQRFVQRLIGASLTGLGQCKAFAYLYGESNTGKSTFMALIDRVFGRASKGGYVCKLPSSVFMRQAGKGQSGHEDRLEHMPRSRFIWCDEVPEGATFDADVLKDVTSGAGAEIRISRKGMPGKSYPVTFGLWFTTEVLTKLKVADGGVFNRQMTLTTTQVIPEGSRNPFWVEQNWEALAPAIAMWALDGARDYLAHGLGDEPTSVLEARGEHRKETALARALLTVLDVCPPAPRPPVVYEKVPPGTPNALYLNRQLKAEADAREAQEAEAACIETPFADIKAALRTWWDARGKGEFPTDRAIASELTSIGCPSKRSSGLTKSNKVAVRLHARLKGLSASGRAPLGNN